MVRAMCGVQLKDIKRYTYLMFVLCLNETIDQLAMANRVYMVTCSGERMVM